MISAMTRCLILNRGFIGPTPALSIYYLC
jgi:hypothetical protein